MAQQSNNNEEIMVWNFWKRPISVRVRADKFVISDEYQKEIKTVYTRSKDKGSAGVGVEGVGNISASGGHEEKKKNSAETESKQKIDAYLNQANFAEIPPDTMGKFSVSHGFKNYVSIIIDGELDCKWNNKNTSDQEVIIQFKPDKPDQVFITSHAVASLYKYLDPTKLFNPSFLMSMKDTLAHFQELYNYVKTTKVNGKPILSDESVKGIARAALDFRGVNLAVKGLLNAVSDEYFGRLLPQVYDEVKQKDPEKLNKDRDRLMALLYDVGKAAKDIGEAFKKVGSWYFNLDAEVVHCHDDVLREADKMDGIRQKIRRLKEERDSAFKEYRRISQIMANHEQLAPMELGWLNILNPLYYIALAFHESWRPLQQKAFGRYQDADRELHRLLPKAQEYDDSFSKLTKLSGSLWNMGNFCQSMAGFFLQRSDRFLNFGKQRTNEAKDMKQEWKAWKTDKCISWVLGLKDGQFSKYENQIKSKFTDEEIDGEELPKLGLRFFEKGCKMDEQDADILIKEIKSLEFKNDNAFQRFKLGYDQAMNWIDTNKKDISDVARILTEINVDFAFMEKGVAPSEWPPIELKSFGSDYVYSPTKEAQNLCK